MDERGRHAKRGFGLWLLLLSVTVLGSVWAGEEAGGQASGNSAARVAVFPAAPSALPGGVEPPRIVFPALQGEATRVRLRLEDDR